MVTTTKRTFMSSLSKHAVIGMAAISLGVIYFSSVVRWSVFFTYILLHKL